MNHCLMFNVVNPSQNAAARASGVYRIAHYLRQNSWDVEVIDFAFSWSLDELKELAKSRVTTNTKFFGFGHMFSDWNDTLESFIIWCKSQWPDLKYISGSSANPVFQTTQFDYYIRGYGEKAILVLLEYLFSNGERPKFWINTGKKIINAIADYPSYPMEDLGVQYQSRDFIEPWEWLTVEFSRGCMFSCDFCNFPLLGVKEDTSRSAESFKTEMFKNYEELGVTNYIVADETFNDRPSKIKKFADVAESLPFETFYSGFIRPDLLVSRPDDRVDLARMNFRGHFYGIESFNHKSAKVVGKGMKTERLQQGLVDVKNYFKSTGNGLYRGTISLIVGLPDETEETMLRTRDWLIKNWSGENIILFPLTIPVGDLLSKPKMFDYEKYGYSEMNIDNINSQNLIVPAFSLVTDNNKFDIDGLCWQNKDMNLLEAREIMFKYFYTPEFSKAMNWKVGNYEMSSYCYGNKTPEQRMNIDSSLSVAALSMKDDNFKSKQFMFDFAKDNFIETYKRRKLSL